MKEITDALNLPESADEAAILEAIEKLKATATAVISKQGAASDHEKAVTKIVQDSGYAISREQAELVLRDRAAQSTSGK